jgi:hypothetical protein
LVVAIVTLREYDKISYHMDEKLSRRKDETIATSVQKKGRCGGAALHKNPLLYLLRLNAVRYYIYPLIT